MGSLGQLPQPSCRVRSRALPGSVLGRKRGGVGREAEHSLFLEVSPREALRTGGKTARAWLCSLAAAFTHTLSLFSKPTTAAGNFPAKLKALVSPNGSGAPAAMVAPSAGPCAAAGAPALPVPRPALAQSPGAERAGAGVTTRRYTGPDQGEVKSGRREGASE